MSTERVGWRLWLAMVAKAFFCEYSPVIRETQ